MTWIAVMPGRNDVRRHQAAARSQPRRPADQEPGADVAHRVVAVAEHHHAQRRPGLVIEGEQGIGPVDLDHAAGGHRDRRIDQDLAPPRAVVRRPDPQRPLDVELVEAVEAAVHERVLPGPGAEALAVEEQARALVRGTVGELSRSPEEEPLDAAAAVTRCRVRKLGSRPYCTERPTASPSVT
jgi:hypothetical protein